MVFKRGNAVMEIEWGGIPGNDDCWILGMMTLEQLPVVHKPPKKEDN
jgi:hypothetical protein